MIYDTKRSTLQGNFHLFLYFFSITYFNKQYFQKIINTIQFQTYKSSFNWFMIRLIYSMINYTFMKKDNKSAKEHKTFLFQKIISIFTEVSFLHSSRQYKTWLTFVSLSIVHLYHSIILRLMKIPDRMKKYLFLGVMHSQRQSIKCDFMAGHLISFGFSWSIHYDLNVLILTENFS